MKKKPGRKPTALRPADTTRRGRPLCAAYGDTGVYTADETEFLAAMEAYRRTRKRPFPTWTECLAVLKGLGYRKTEGPTRETP